MNHFDHKNNEQNLCAYAVLFVQEFFVSLLEHRDLDSVQNMLQEKLIWAGSTGQTTIADSIECKKILQREMDFFNAHGNIKNQSIQATYLDEHFISTSGTIILHVDEPANCKADVSLFYSGICKYEDDKFLLSQVHISIPSIIPMFLEQKTSEQEPGKKLLQRITDIIYQKEQRESFSISQTRYEVALKSSGLTMFEYNIKTKDLMLFEDTAQMYGMPTTIKNGVETFIKQEIIQPESVPVYREMYQKILDGAPFAKCYVVTKDVDGVKHDFELSLTNVYDEDGQPIRAIGVRKNVSQILHLQKEKEFGQTLVHDKLYILQADLMKDEILYWNEEWRKESDLEQKCSYSNIISTIIPQSIFPADQEIVRQKLSTSYIIQKFEQDISMFSFTYRRKDADKNYAWYEATVSIIRDHTTGAINIRLYNSNINPIKENEIKATKALKEQQLFESVLSSTKLTFEVNLSNNLILHGGEKLNELYGFSKADCYSEVIAAFARNDAHPEDSELFEQTFCLERVLEEFSKGERAVSCQYRKKKNDKDYQWSCTTLRLFEDPDTNHIRGYAYVEDIDKQKKAELSLHYNAEHDALTKLYNKATTENRIVECLTTSDTAYTKHAFIMIDIDHFKLVNDLFGHLFGDNVLTDIGEHIKHLFEVSSITGRIGGDEFCVFLKNADSEASVLAKAEKLCDCIRHTYSQSQKSCTISASLGIAMYPKHGMTYQELFESADKAMYISKKKGRDMASFPPTV